ncbi:MAG: SDR family NAD(P)-dependent oxidoreductase, partial [Myxococcales bacterium]|nr:SDR family NAD(P)-dependent oxidoreductase [Myxococcales bacterium]
VARLVRDLPELLPTRERLHADATYLISGGTGGLGLSLARWMVEHGARHLLLLARRPPSPAASAEIAALTAAGATIAVAQADVADRDELARVLAAIPDLLPLRGVVHAAGSLADRTARDLGWPQLAAVMAPKLVGAWHLHALTLAAPLDFFALYSAAAALVGSPGQANYAAANAFMDALAEERRRQGRVARAIAWGPFSGVGLAAAASDRGERLATRGLGSLTPARGEALLPRLLGPAGPAHLGVLDLDVRRWLESNPGAAAQPFWSELRRDGPGSPAAPTGRAREQIAALAPAGRLAALERLLAETLARVLRLPAASIERDRPLGGLGVDSLMSLEIRNRLEAALGLKLSATLLFTYPDLASLAAYLLPQLALGDAPAPTPSPLALPTRTADEPIAIVGIGCRFPGDAATPDTYWHNLLAGVDTIHELPDGRWPPEDPALADPALARAVRWGAWLRDVDRFEPEFFAISPREAASLDPQQRLLLEVTWEALEHGGFLPDALAGTRTGVFVGMSNDDYARNTAADPRGEDIHGMTGNGHCFPPGRLAYTFGLEGPALTVDTACSSSLVAVHLACQSLRAGESELALAAGVNLVLAPRMTRLLARSGALAPDGRCKAFDAEANGFVRGEGCGVVVLKRL